MCCLNFRSDTFEKQGFINLTSYSSKRDGPIVLKDLEVTFLEKVKDAVMF